MTSGPSAESIALHLRIRRDIEADIRAGHLRPGAKIAFEHELMAQYDCSRMTVNKALSALNAAGLIERRKRAGTFVKTPRIDSTVLNIPDIQVDIHARGEAYRFECLSHNVRSPRNEAETELAGPEGRVLALTGLHYASEAPLAFEERLISLAAVPQAASFDFSTQSPGHWLLEAIPWTQAENQISAAPADPATAKQLKIPRGAACLVIERRTWRAESRITWVRLTHDASRYGLSAVFDRA